MVETLEAFKFVPVADLKSRKVSALSYWYDRTNDAMNVYVGTYKGEVVWFQFSLPSQSESSVASSGVGNTSSSSHHSLASREVGSVLVSTKRKRIRTLDTIPELNRLLILSEDGRLSVRNLESLEPVECKSLSRHRAATLFTLNKSGPPLFPLCVAEKKKLYLYEYARGHYRFLKEIPVTQTPMEMEWLEHHICLGFRKTYCMLDARTGEVSEVPGLLDESTPPNMKLMPDSQLLVVGAPSLGMFLYFNATPVPRNPLQWTTLPVSFGYSPPYLLSLFRNCLEVHKFGPAESGKMPELVQRLDLSRVAGSAGGGSILVDGGFQSEFETSAAATVSGKRSSQSDGIAFVVAGRTILLVQQVPFKDQIQTLLDKVPPQVQAAKELLQSTIRGSLARGISKSEFAARAAFVLFRDLQFDQAALQWTIAVENGDGHDPRELLMLYPEYQVDGFSFRSNGAFNRKMLRLANSARTTDSLFDIKDFVQITLAQRKGMLNETLFIEYIHSARCCLARVLIACRHSTAFQDRLRRDGGEEAMRTVDTGLFLVLLDLQKNENVEDDGQKSPWRDALLHLVSHTSACDLVQAERMLSKAGLEQFLALLYRSRGMKVQTCEVWERLLSEGRSGWGQWQNGPKVIESLVQFLCSADVNPGLEPKDATLTLRFTKELMESFPEEMLSIFTQRIEVEQLRSSAMKPLRVIEHLQGHAENQLLRKYLECLLGVKNDGSFITETHKPIDYDILLFGTRLAVEYFKVIQAKKKSIDDVRKKFLQFLKTAPLHVYDTSKVLECTRLTELHEENVELYRRQHRHKEALDILVNHMNDIDAAEAYCVQSCICSDYVGGEKRNAFVVLLDILFRSSAKGEREENFVTEEKAFEILQKYALVSRKDQAFNGFIGIDPLEVLDVIPEDVPICKVLPFLEKIVPQRFHDLRQAHVRSNLQKFNAQISKNCCIKGCMNKNALNYDEDAERDDGSCAFKEDEPVDIEDDGTYKYYDSGFDEKSPFRIHPNVLYNWSFGSHATRMDVGKPIVTENDVMALPEGAKDGMKVTDLWNAMGAPQDEWPNPIGIPQVTYIGSDPKSGKHLNVADGWQMSGG
eukprot:g5868.t1